MGWMLAMRTFFKALKDPEGAERFLEGQPKQVEEKKDPSHLRLLSLLQQSGRLIDFLKEDITPYSDAQVGAAVRKIHAECGKSLEEWVTIRPVVQEKEGEQMVLQPGYDPAAYKVVGKVKGDAPYTGKLIHQGWRAHKHSLPKQVGDSFSEILCPAEIEVK